MLYRSLGKCGLKASVVGLGCEHLKNNDFQTIERTIKTALDCELNIFDALTSDHRVLSYIGKALESKRDRIIIQGHIETVFENGQYPSSKDLIQNQLFFEEFMSHLRTNYIDIGMIHIVDTPEDYDSVFNSGTIEYAAKLKRQGIIKAIGLSSHSPTTALKAVKTGLIDILMFSINPAFDMLPEIFKFDNFFIKDRGSNDTLLDTVPLRTELYHTCERMGVGITVMKTLAGGQLLNEKLSPFQEVMSVHQCMHYALTRPGVSSVLIGCRTPEEVSFAASYIEKTDQEKDYSSVLSKTPRYSMTGKCVYCNHCLPCPEQIDIASVTKYLDLATIADDTVPASIVDPYKDMPANAEDCTECGICESNCPFNVKIIENMRKAREIFK